MRMPRLSVVGVTAIASLIALAGLTIAVTVLTQRLTVSGGLAGTYRAGTIADSRPWMRAIDREISSDLIWQRARERAGEPFSVEWSGYLLVPETREYRFALRAKTAAGLSLDGVPVGSSNMPRGGSPLEVTRGLHRLQLEYVASDKRPALEVLWASAFGPFTRVSPLLFVPDVLVYSDVRLRQFVVAMDRAIPWIWFVALWTAVAYALVKMRAGDWLWPELTRAQLAGLALILGFSCVLFATGVSWGAPDHLWAPDEVRPSGVLDGMQQRFANGWATIYPPLHFAILALFYTPFLLAGALHLINFSNPDVGSDLFTAARLVSVVMAIGIVGLVYAAARELNGPRAGALAAMIALSTMPITFYAKTTNLDVPYLFWLSLALLAYIKILRRHSPRNYYLFALAAVASICTKDQAYGFFVLPVCLLLWRSLRYRRSPDQPPGTATPGMLWRLSLVCLLGFAAAQNLPWNWQGFVEHLRLIVGPASEGYRMFPRTLAGYGAMSKQAFVQLGHVMGWPLFLSSIVGVTVSLLRGDRATRWLLLPALSYCLFFIAVVMYHYDRFFLGVALILAVVSGSWFADWTKAGVRGRWIRAAVVVVIIAHALARAVALDALMIRDSRYAAERRLVPLGLRSDVIAGIGGYLPRQSVLGWTPLPADFADVETKKPRYLILNVAFNVRDEAGSPRRLFYEALSQGKAGYALAFRTRTAPMFPLSLEGEFQQVTDDPFSNLTKINPLIEVYVRDDRAR
jgi:hypothetical protein